jgi:hypothetical protein
VNLSLRRGNARLEADLATATARAKSGATSGRLAKGWGRCGTSLRRRNFASVWPRNTPPLANKPGMRLGRASAGPTFSSAPSCPTRGRPYPCRRPKTGKNSARP